MEIQEYQSLRFGALYKCPVYIFMPNWVSEERLKLMKMYGAKVILISAEEGGFARCVEEARKFAYENNAFLVNQFSNKENIDAHYETTGNEIIRDIGEHIDAFVSGVGSGGTLMGVAKRLKSEFDGVKIVAVEPEKMPIMSKGEVISRHKIEGIGDDFVPEIVDRSVIDDIILINDNDAVNMSRKLSQELGLGVGISSGANFIGAALTNEKGYSPTVTVFADDNKKYLSTSLADDIDLDDDFISNKIKLLRYERRINRRRKI